jgi:hypothetical protein
VATLRSLCTLPRKCFCLKHFCRSLGGGYPTTLRHLLETPRGKEQLRCGKGCSVQRSYPVSLSWEMTLYRPWLLLSRLYPHYSCAIPTGSVRPRLVLPVKVPRPGQFVNLSLVLQLLGVVSNLVFFRISSLLARIKRFRLEYTLSQSFRSDRSPL